MQIEDDRTPEQRKTHKYLIVGTDNFLSGWGKAKGGKSYAAWACEGYEAAKKAQEWVERRGDMKRVRQVYGDYRPSGTGHLRIYVVNEGHPATR